MYKHEKVCDIPIDQIHWLPSQLYYEVNICFLWQQRTDFQNSPEAVEVQLTAGANHGRALSSDLIDFWLFHSLVQPEDAQWVKTLLPVPNKGIFHLSSNSFHNERWWFIQPHCVYPSLTSGAHNIRANRSYCWSSDSLNRRRVVQLRVISIRLGQAKHIQTFTAQRPFYFHIDKYEWPFWREKSQPAYIKPELRYCWTQAITSAGLMQCCPSKMESPTQTGNSWKQKDSPFLNL